MSGFKKAIKKVTKPVVKAATLGAIDGKSGGWMKGTDGVLNTFTLGAMGKGAMEGPLNMQAGAAAAAKSQQEAAAYAARLEQTRFDSQATALKNQTLLEGVNSARNTVQVQTGGGDTPDSVLNDMRRRKRPSASVATGLGIY